MKHDDCFEKSDLINRINEYKQRKKGGEGGGDSGRQFGRSATSGPGETGGFAFNKENAYNASNTAKSSQPSFIPKEDHIAFKIISVGNQEVGKSCLIKRYCEGRFVRKYISTIGIDYGVKKLTVKGRNIAINFFDLSGNDDYKIIR